MTQTATEPAEFLLDHAGLFARPLPGPVLDLACGDGHNGLYLASLGHDVVLCDRSTEALGKARLLAERAGLKATIRQMDLEKPGTALPADAYGAILVFRYLHRPLIPSILASVRPGGLVVYETFTEAQQAFDGPHNPDFLLHPGELAGWFTHWEILHTFEGILDDPPRAMARVIARKPPRDSR